MNARSLAVLTALLALPAVASADNFNWGGTWVADWDNFGTSPYTAIDTTLNPHQTIQIFCLDFNDSIAPPIAWTASILDLNEPNVAGTGPFGGTYAAQYGGSYNALLQAAFNNKSNPRPASETTPPQVSGVSTGKVPPFAFNSDNAGGGYSINLTPSNNTPDSAYTRYLEAAWLFQDILAGLPGDVHTDIVAQVAAWELFVNNSNLAELTNDVKTYGGKFVFNNYLALGPGQTYLTNTSVQTQGTPSISFEQAVDAALSAAQTAVVTNGWGPGSNDYGSWSLVTTTPDYVISYGEPVQEFLSPNAVPYSPPSHISPINPVIPEPKAVLLLGSAIAIVLGIQRRRRAPASR